MRKLILFVILVFSFNLLALESFNSGELIERENINGNIQEINNYLSQYSISPYFSEINSSEIKAEDFNMNLIKLNNNYSLGLDLIQKNELISAENVNSYFSTLISGMENNLFFTNCNNRNNTNTGFYTIDYDGFSGVLAPVREYCNYNDGAANLNKFKVDALSSDYERGSGNYAKVNGYTTSHGRGVGIAVFDKNLNLVFNRGYDNYHSSNGAAAANNLKNDLLNTSRVPLNSLIVFTSADSSETHLGFNSTLNSLFSCSIAGLPHREAYLCISYKNSLGERIKVYEGRGNQLHPIKYIDYTDFYNFLSK